MPENVGRGKGIKVGDVNQNGEPDVVFSCENARDGRSGVMWLSYQDVPTENVWMAHDISAP